MTSKHNTAERRAEDSRRIRELSMRGLAGDAHPGDFENLIDEIFPLPETEDVEEALGGDYVMSPALNASLRFHAMKLEAQDDEAPDDFEVVGGLCKVIDEYRDWMPDDAFALLYILAVEMFRRAERSNPMFTGAAAGFRKTISKGK